jgi:glycosyltransferase involved in cell wall biosynthesis
MRILMLLENEFLRDSRVEKEVQSLFNAGHEIIVAAITSTGLPYYEKRGNCTVLRKSISPIVAKSSVGALKFPFYLNFWKRYTERILADFKADVIHIHDLPLSRVGVELKKNYKIRLVIDLHENWPSLLSVSVHTNTFLGKLLSSEKQWRAYEKSCTLQAEAVITVVDEMKTRISDLGVPAGKIYVLENTPETSELKKLQFSRDENYFTLLYVGGISFHRGLQYAIEGMRLLIKEIPARLWIAGDGKYTTVLKDQVKRLELEKYVMFYGQLPKKDTEDLMKKSDFGLIPHIRSEQSDNSSPNKLFEYMASGLPILASNCISVKRVLEETNSGISYIYDSPSDFADKVKKLYSGRKDSSVYTINGINAVANKYNWLHSSSSLLKLYKDLE